MNKIIIRAKEPVERAKEICYNFYNLRYDEYDLEQVNKNTCEVTFKNETKLRDSKVYVTTDEGAYNGYLTMLPALNDAKMHSLNDLYEYLKEEKFVNLNYEQLMELFRRFSEGEVIDHVLIVKGVKPKKGKDADLTLCFNKETPKPKIRDGKVDYKDIDNIVMVRKGSVLVTKKPAVRGVSGFNIKGEEIKPEPVQDVRINNKNGTEVNETGTVFRASIDGYVEFTNKNDLGVYPVYTVSGTVDYSTGNVVFNGTVYIKGDVLSGFRVEASKDIVVEGICQDCELIARGNIILKTGIKGNGSGIIRAGKSVHIGYAESTSIFAKEDIEIKKYAYNCDLFAGENIYALGEEGIIAGGNIRAFKEIVAEQIGTTGNSNFTIYLGTKYYEEIALAKIKEKKESLNEIINKIDVLVKRYDRKRISNERKEKIEEMKKAKIQLNDSIVQLTIMEEDFVETICHDSPRVKVKQKIYDGVTIRIFNHRVVLREQLLHSVVYYDKKFDEILWVNLGSKNVVELKEELV